MSSAMACPSAFPSSPDTGPGLTEAGKALVRRCNELKIMLDVSHLNEKGFWDVARHSTAPIVATHSNAHALCASSRNLTDDQIRIIGKSGGMIGLNFANGFLRADGRWSSENGLDSMLRHLDHLMKLAGEDHVGLGSDFDGARIPSQIGDVTGLPRLIGGHDRSMAMARNSAEEAVFRELVEGSGAELGRIRRVCTRLLAVLIIFMKLSEWLTNSGTSQSELARRLGITQGRVSQLVAGAQPSLELANKIAAATGNKVRPQDFGDQTMANEQKLDTVEEAIKAIADGQMVVVVDDDDRENEGDLIAAAAKITPEQMAFMVRHTSGIVCTPITAEDARRLKLDPMVALNDAPMGTAFTVTIDYKEGLTTGISAKERAPPAMRWPTAMWWRMISCGPAISSRWSPSPAAC